MLLINNNFMKRFYFYLKVLVYFLMFVTALQILFLSIDIAAPLCPQLDLMIPTRLYQIIN